MQINLLNLDAMTVDELNAVGNDSQAPLAYRLYAKRKALAMRARLEGNIRLALVFEADCDAIYARMHRDFRW